jgi:hypothetical protein
MILAILFLKNVHDEGTSDRLRKKIEKLLSDEDVTLVVRTWQTTTEEVDKADFKAAKSDLDEISRGGEEGWKSRRSLKE